MGGWLPMGSEVSPETVGDWYVTALAHNVNGSSNNELIHTSTFSDVVDVEIAICE